MSVWVFIKELEMDRGFFSFRGSMWFVALVY